LFVPDCGPAKRFQNDLLLDYGHHEVGYEVTYGCQENYQMIDKNGGYMNENEAAIMCNDDGVWEIANITCQRKYLSLKFLCIQITKAD